MRFEIEWQDAPGVKDRVLGPTWARLRISVGDQDVTELIDPRSESRRAAVYGPAFPLAEWLVENWWHLLYEPSPSTPLRPGRGAPPWRRAWVQRHNLLAAREGTPLPDATFVRDGDEILVRWFPDFDPYSRGERVRFIGGAQRRIPVAEFEKAAASFVEVVLERVLEMVGADEDGRRLQDAWRAIRTSDQDEQYLCRALAILGVDPYDPEQATEPLVRLLEDLRVELPSELLDDLIEGSDPARLQASAQWLGACRRELANGESRHEYRKLPLAWEESAHGTGYKLARALRSSLLGDAAHRPIDDLQAFLSKVGWGDQAIRVVPSNDVLDGCVGVSKDTGRPIVLVPGARKKDAERFLLARGLFFTAADKLGSGRLLNRATTRQQRASRAFAAELLAPASALASAVSGRVSMDDVASLAESFGVSQVLIQHQLENHGIATLTE